MNSIKGLLYLIMAIPLVFLNMLIVPIVFIIHHTIYKLAPNKPIIRWFDSDLVEEVIENIYWGWYLSIMLIWQILTNRNIEM